MIEETTFQKLYRPGTSELIPERVVMAKPPSRRRYEKENPTVSVRLPREAKEWLEAEAEKRGTSKSRIIKEALNVYQKETEAIRQEAFDEGFTAGYQGAVDEIDPFVASMRCLECGEILDRVDLRDKESRGIVVRPVETTCKTCRD